MQYFELSWTTVDGIQIFAQAWQAAPHSRAVVCLVHGMGEHSGRYLHVARALTQAGFSLITFDQRGHGRSQGQRGHTHAYELLMDDLACLLVQAEHHFPQQPCFLYGHSMGGNLVLNYALRRRPQLAGVLATAPWLRLVSPPPALQLKFLSLVNPLWPSLALPNRLDPRILSRDPAVVEAYRHDRLVHDRISVRFFSEVYQAGQWALTQAHHFSLPLLLLHGSADRLTSAEASREFTAQIADDCLFKLWEGLYHEPHNEPEQQDVLAFIIRWLQARTP
jgi:alpha-beta hydrolase superfamily lysophospholipase